MWKRSTDWNGEREALGRILVALASMAGLLDAAGFCLPRDIYCAVARPLRAAEAAARLLPPDLKEGSPAAVHLKRCFAALRRALDALVRQMRQPAPERMRRPTHESQETPAGPRAAARRVRRDSS